MPAFKTEGIVLKRKNFGEADRILTVFTKRFGKVTVLAKGVRRITSRRAGNVELLNRVIMFLYQGKNFYILTEAESIDTYEKLKSDLTLSTYAYHLIELTDKLTAENQENIAVYEDLIEVLEKLSKNPRQIFIRAYEAKILSNLGFLSFEGKEMERMLEVSTWEQIEEMKIEGKEAMELENRLRYHIERVLEGELKSRKFLRKI